MKRFSDLEKKYVLEVLDDEFRSSRNNIFTARLEAKFAETFHRKFAVSFVNGTATMHTALAALGVKPGDEVIVPPLTMSSPALAVLHNGSVPVFADVDRKTFNISADSILANITEKTRAVITVSLYGLAPDYDKITQICKEKGIFLIEDNAESFLSKYKGKLVGEFGDFASFSFQASKHLTCGEGGMLVTDNEVLADKARKFAGLGYGSIGAKKGRIARADIQDPNFSRHVCFGFNYRISELQSAVALGQLERAEELVEVRIKSAKIFTAAIKNFPYLVPQRTPKNCVNSYWSYSMLLDIENHEHWYQFRDLFVKNGGDGVYAAWKLTYQEPYFQNEVQNYPGVRQKYAEGLCPNAEHLQKRMLQFKTNYWDLAEAKKQAEILKQTAGEFKRIYLKKKPGKLQI